VSVGKMYVHVLLLLRVLFIGAETWVGGERPLYEEEVVIIWPKLLQQTQWGVRVTGYRRRGGLWVAYSKNS
jgi:hypothetical protein